MDLPDLSGRTALVVEDNALVRETVTEALELLGATVLQAQDGTIGIEMAKQRRPDLVVSNYNMPGASGVDVLEALRADPQTVDVPFVLITANPSPGLRARCERAGANAVLDKSTGLVELVEVLQRVLRKAEAR